MRPVPPTWRTDVPPFTPSAWAETPTQAKPCRMSSVWSPIQSGAVSAPALSFSHSTMTVPLNFRGSAGRYTTSLVLYRARARGSTFQRPSAGAAPFIVKRVAVPEMKYSASWYPTVARLNDVPMMNGVPGPVIGPSTVGTGTDDRGNGARAGAAEAGATPVITDTTTTAATTATTDPRLLLSTVRTSRHQSPLWRGPAQKRAQCRTGPRPRDGRCDQRVPRAPERRLLSGQRGQLAGVLTWATTNPPSPSPLVLVPLSV